MFNPYQVTIVPREPVSDVLLPPGIDPHVFHSLNPEQRASVVKAAGVMKLFGTKFIAPEAQARRSKIAIYVAHNSSKCTYQTALYKSRDRVDCETRTHFTHYSFIFTPLTFVYSFEQWSHLDVIEA